MGRVERVDYFEIITFLLLVIGQRVVVSVGGELSLTTIFILLTSPIWVRRLNFNEPTLRRICRIYAALLLIQLFTESISSTALEDKAKGVAITLNSILTLSYFLYRFCRNLALVKYYLLGTAIGFMIFPNVLSEIEGSEFGYYKFTLVPLLVNALVAATLFVPSRYIKPLSPLLWLSGLIFMLSGARSSGVSLLLVGLLSMLLLYNRGLTIKSLNRTVLMLGVLLYAVYALIYVPIVMSGQVDSVGNSAQLKSVENPYNPLSLLVVGRTESFVSLVAFAQKPLWGWGYNADDPDLKYTQLLYSIKGVDVPTHRTFTKIPAHSVVGTSALAYGIGGAIMIMVLLIYILSLGVRRLFDRSKYVVVLLYVLFSILWNAPFSPASHLKTSMSMMFAVILAIDINWRRYINVSSKIAPPPNFLKK